MRTRRLLQRLSIGLIGLLCAVAGFEGAAKAQAQGANAGPVQPWGLPPLPQGVGSIEKFADIHDTPQGRFLEGGAFDTQGNLWFVGIGSGWVSYQTAEGRLVSVVNCNPPEEIGQTCEPQGTRWRKGTIHPHSPHT